MSSTFNENQVYICHGWDHDSLCAAAIVKRRYPGARFTPMKNGRFPTDRVSFGGTVVVIGPMLTPKELRQLASQYYVVWFEHRDLILEQAMAYWKVDSPLDIPLDGLRTVGAGSAILTWEWCYGTEVHPPRVVEYVSDYVTWKPFTYTESVPMNYGLSIMDRWLNNQGLSNWEALLNDDDEFVQSVLCNGNEIMHYLDQRDAITINTVGYVVSVDGLKCLVANTSANGSVLFNEHPESDSCDAAIIYGWNNSMKKFIGTVFRMRDDVDLGPLLGVLSEDTQVSSNAGRFMIDRLPWDYPDCEDELEMESPFEDMYAELVAENHILPTVQLYHSKCDKSTYTRFADICLINGHKTRVCNTPHTWRSVWSFAGDYGTMVCMLYTMTKCGKYRLIFFTKGDINPEEYALSIGGRLMPNKSIWKYVDENELFELLRYRAGTSL